MQPYFQSKNKRILLFSDVHQEIDKLEHLLATEKYDIAISLGDWWDSFSYDSARDVTKTCRFLKKWLFEKNHYTIKGNHDLPYLYKSPYALCPGWTEQKMGIVNAEFSGIKSEVVDKFKWFFWVDDYLCSHAGLNANHLKPHQDLSKENLTEWLSWNADFADRSLESMSYHWMYLRGASRGGKANTGGIVWQDWDSEFQPIDGLKQIVGHTPHSQVRNHPLEDIFTFNNIDIDCHLNQYLIIEDNRLWINKYNDL